jgi:adenylate cyclase
MPDPMHSSSIFLRHVLSAAGCCAALWVLPQGVDMNEARVCLDSCHAQERRGDFRSALEQAGRARTLAYAAADTAAVGYATLAIGTLHHRMGDLDQALEQYISGLKVFESIGDVDGRAEALNNIGSVHHYDRNYAKAGDYYAQSLVLRRMQNDSTKLALPYNNLGSLLEDSGQPDSALYYHRLGLAIRLAQGDSTWVAITHAHIGSCYDQLDQIDSALFHLRLAEHSLAAIGSPFLCASTRRMLGTACLHAGLLTEALRWCSVAFSTARKVGDPYLEQESCECLHQANEQLGRHAEAYVMLTRFVALRDSMFGAERAKERTRIALTYEFESQQLADSIADLVQRQQAELEYQELVLDERDQKRLYLYSGLVALLIIGGLWNRLAFTRRSRRRIQRERDRSERLLRNILPASIAEELKESGRALSREVAEVSILFTDFHAFTKHCESMGAQELVEEIDTCFRAFDAICVEHGLEKIKTIGDAYMCAGGLPTSWPDSTIATVRAALAMQAWLERHYAERSAAGQPAFRMRAGIHTGAVVAGIVGDTKFQYDVWGDAVNTAARMESNGAVGRVNISATTYELVRNEAGLHFEARGNVPVKGKSDIIMYFVEAV